MVKHGIFGLSTDKCVDIAAWTVIAKHLDFFPIVIKLHTRRTRKEQMEQITDCGMWLKKEAKEQVPSLIQKFLVAQLLLWGVWHSF